MWELFPFVGDICIMIMYIYVTHKSKWTRIPPTLRAWCAESRFPMSLWLQPRKLHTFIPWFYPILLYISCPGHYDDCFGSYCSFRWQATSWRRCSYQQPDCSPRVQRWWQVFFGRCQASFESFLSVVHKGVSVTCFNYPQTRLNDFKSTIRM